MLFAQCSPPRASPLPPIQDSPDGENSETVSVGSPADLQLPPIVLQSTPTAPPPSKTSSKVHTKRIRSPTPSHAKSSTAKISHRVTPSAAATVVGRKERKTDGSQISFPRISTSGRVAKSGQGKSRESDSIQSTPERGLHKAQERSRQSESSLNMSERIADALHKGQERLKEGRSNWNVTKEMAVALHKVQDKEREDGRTTSFPELQFPDTQDDTEFGISQAGEIVLASSERGDLLRQDRIGRKKRPKNLKPEEKKDMENLGAYNLKRHYMRQSVFHVDYQPVNKVAEQSLEAVTGVADKQLLSYIQRYAKLDAVLTMLQSVQRGEVIGEGKQEMKLSGLRDHIKRALDEAVRLRAETETLRYSTEVGMVKRIFKRANNLQITSHT